jgi:hypothetical protein
LAKPTKICQTSAKASAARGKHFANLWQNHMKFAKHWQIRPQRGGIEGRARLR